MTHRKAEAAQGPEAREHDHAPATRRLRQLDVLRGIAILLVLGRHTPAWPRDYAPILRPLMETWGRCGWIGVDLFFVLSGFLVSGLLFREHIRHARIHLLRFLLRRGLKIYPAFYVFLGATLAIGLAGGRPVQLRPVLASAAFLQNYFPTLGIWEHSWSLAVEEHFYLLIGLALLLLSRSRAVDPFRTLVAGFCVVAPVLLLLRVLTYHGLPYTHFTHLYPTHLRIDSLLFGVVLSYLYHYRHDAMGRIVMRHRIGIVGCSLLLILPCILLDLAHNGIVPTLGLTCLYLGFGGLMAVSLFSHPRLPWALDKAVATVAGIGVYSYSIYLWHLPLSMWGGNLLGAAVGTQWPRYLVSLQFGLSSIVIGILMAKLIEFPILALRDRYLPSRSGVLEAQETDLPVPAGD